MLTLAIVKNFPLRTRLFLAALRTFLLITGMIAAAWQPVAAQQRTDDLVPFTLTIEGGNVGLRELIQSQLNRRLQLQAEAFGLWQREYLEEQVLKTLQALGHLDPKITLELTTDPPSIGIRIQPGMATTVSSFELVISGPSDAQIVQTLRQRILDTSLNPNQLKVGDTFTANGWEKLKSDALSLIQQRQYFGAKIIASEALLDTDSASARLRLEIQTGPPVIIGSINVNGIKRYSLPRVRELLGFDTGTPFDAPQLGKAQLALLDTRWFSSVTIIPLASQAEPDKVSIDVTVVERPSQRLTLGLGFSSDLGPRAKIAFEDTSIGPRGWAANSAITVNKNERTLEFGTRTQTDRTGNSYGLNLRFHQQDINNEKIDQSLLSAYRSKRTERLDIVTSLSWQRERKEVLGQNEEKSHALVPAWSWNYRTLDDRINPRTGYTVNTQVSGAAQKLGSSTNFARTYARGTWFKPLSAQADASVLALRGEAGLVIASQIKGVPSDNLFRTGGGQSVRGYGYQTLGIQQTNGTSTAVIGAKQLFSASAELFTPVKRFYSAAPANLDWSVFYDVGNATDHLRADTLAHGIGFGVRWRSLVGPVNFALAYADQTKRLRAHFSVGFTF
jgi:translocation and assembly module TamA